MSSQKLEAFGALGYQISMSRRVHYWVATWIKNSLFRNSHDVQVECVMAAEVCLSFPLTGNKRIDYAKGAADCNGLASPTLSKLSASCGAGERAGFALIA